MAKPGIQGSMTTTIYLPDGKSNRTTGVEGGREKKDRTVQNA